MTERKPIPTWKKYLLAGSGVIVVGSVLAMVFIDAPEDDTPPTRSEMRTDAGDSFRQSIARNVRAEDADSLRIACDSAEARLDRSTEELQDWGDLIPSCNAGLAGDWSEAVSNLPR